MKGAYKLMLTKFIYNVFLNSKELSLCCLNFLLVLQLYFLLFDYLFSYIFNLRVQNYAVYNVIKTTDLMTMYGMLTLG